MPEWARSFYQGGIKIVNDYNEECENCQCYECEKNSLGSGDCDNCDKCSGNNADGIAKGQNNRWTMDCKNYEH